MAERESRNWFVFGKIHELEMCVSDCIQKISVSGQAFCSSEPGIRRGNEDSCGNENRKLLKNFFSAEKQIDKHTFFFFKQSVGVAESLEITP